MHHRQGIDYGGSTTGDSFQKPGGSTTGGSFKPSRLKPSGALGASLRTALRPAPRPLPRCTQVRARAVSNKGLAPMGPK